MSGFTVNVDLSVAAAALDDGTTQGLRNGTEFLLTEANKSVPHDEGTLERSGEASVDTQQLRGAVSYDTPYAVVQHEAMDYRHGGKGEAKWLENAMTREASTIGELVAAAVRSKLSG